MPELKSFFSLDVFPNFAGFIFDFVTAFSNISLDFEELAVLVESMAAPNGALSSQLSDMRLRRVVRKTALLAIIVILCLLIANRMTRKIGHVTLINPVSYMYVYR